MKYIKLKLTIENYERIIMSHEQFNKLERIKREVCRDTYKINYNKLPIYFIVKLIIESGTPNTFGPLTCTKLQFRKASSSNLYLLALSALLDGN